MWPKGEAKVCNTFYPGSSPGVVLTNGLVRGRKRGSPLVCQARDRQFEPTGCFAYLVETAIVQGSLIGRATGC